MSAEHSKAIGPKFFNEQDRLKGGPARDLCAEGYTARIAGFPPFDFHGHEELNALFDQMGLMRQLGLLPEQSGAKGA